MDHPDDDTLLEPAEPPRAAVSLMITRRQRIDLNALGVTDEAIAVMSPAEAHDYLRRHSSGSHDPIP